MSSNNTPTPKTVVAKKGAAKKAVPKPRKVLRDNIQGITKPALRRLLERAGVKRVKDTCYEELRSILKFKLENTLRGVITFTEYNQRKTVSVEDLKAALEVEGIYLGAGLNETAKRTASLQSCNSRGKSSAAPAVKEEKKEEEPQQPRKPHRFRPGTVALRNIRKQQKNSDCLAIPKTNFERLVREVTQDFKTDCRFGDGVIELLQLVIEEYMVKLAEYATDLAIHAKRESVSPKDFKLVLKIKGERQ
jgi:histone H3